MIKCDCLDPERHGHLDDCPLAESELLRERLAETEALLLAASLQIERLKDIIWRARDWVECDGVADRILAEADSWNERA